MFKLDVYGIFGEYYRVATLNNIFLILDTKLYNVMCVPKELFPGKAFD